MDANELKEEGAQAAEELHERGWAWADRAKQKLQQAGSATDDYVHENVWTTAALVALVAVTIGWLIGRRS
jgi:ElaB/YqjD/DUF883 family membrane-anchored ribosome-binding protein